MIDVGGYMARSLVLVWLFVALLCGASIAAEMKGGAITGRLQTKTKAPLNNALVFLFNERSGPPPAPDNRYWRVPDEVTETDIEGRFVIAVPPGNYYLGAIKRLKGKDVGPPTEGDLFVTSVDTKGSAIKYNVTNDLVDVGTIAEAVPFNGEMTSKLTGISAVEGIVQTKEGQPVKGASVFAFTSSTMIGKPVFVSAKTGDDGKYLLRVMGGGTYYLKARESYGGGPPKIGSMIGNYGEESPVPVPVKAGEVTKGINVNVSRFAGQRPAKR
jgi:hypothetical protein